MLLRTDASMTAEDIAMLQALNSRSNQGVLQNLKKLEKAGIRIHFRVSSMCSLKIFGTWSWRVSTI